MKEVVDPVTGQFRVDGKVDGGRDVKEAALALFVVKLDKTNSLVEQVAKRCVLYSPERSET